MGLCSKREKKEKSCGRKLFCFLLVVSVVSIVAIATWYFVFFAKDVELLIGDCGGCYCIPDNTTTFRCPTGKRKTPPASYPEKTHLNTWKSLTILNPYVLNCNPYEDGVFCDTEPLIDPDFQWTKLGETAVCAVHYESENPQRRGLKKELSDKQHSEIEVADFDFLEDLDDDANITGNVTAIDVGKEIETFTIVEEIEKCENPSYYRIKTYPSREEAELSGGFVTHVGYCGVCSTLQDLAVYANIDFVSATSPGNFCRRQAATSFENGLSCYRGLGMTQDCAKIWADTSWNTAKNCFGSCVLKSTLPQLGGNSDTGNDIFTDPNENSNITKIAANVTTSSNKWYDLPATLRDRFVSLTNRTNNEDESDSEETLRNSIPGNGPAPECALNDCITCNDEVSAPTFERFAGRTRQRSGLLSTAARPCGSLPNIIHDPCPNTKPLID